jgi:hypothetical protein
VYVVLNLIRLVGGGGKAVQRKRRQREADGMAKFARRLRSFREM